VISNDSSGKPETDFALAADNMPYTVLGYTNGRGHANGIEGDDIYAADINAGRFDLTNIDTTLSGYHQEALIPLSSETHAGEDVALFATGAGSYLFNGVMEQNVIYHGVVEAVTQNFAKKK